MTALRDKPALCYCSFRLRSISSLLHQAICDDGAHATEAAIEPSYKKLLQFTFAGLWANQK